MNNSKVLKEYKNLLRDKYHMTESECCKACEKCKDFYDEAYFEDDVSGATFDDLEESLAKDGHTNSVKMTEDFLSLVKGNKAHLR